MRISTVGYSVKQGVRNIGRNKLFSIASIATMSACIFMFGLFFAIVLNFNYIIEKAEEGVAIVVFFEDGITQAEIDNIGSELRARDEVLEISFTTAEEAWEEFKGIYLKDNVELAEGFKDNPLASSANYKVYLADIVRQAELVSFTESLPGVRRVNKSDAVADMLTNLNRLVWYVSAGIILILLAVSIFLINNTVAMGVEVRKEEIGIMKYIGAKDGFVKAPFVIEGLLIGFIGAVIPLILLYFGYEKAIHYILTKFHVLGNILEFLPINAIYMQLLPIGLALGVGIGFVGSFFTIHKHLKV